MLLGLMLEDQPFEHGLRGLPLVVVELLQPPVLQAQGSSGPRPASEIERLKTDAHLMALVEAKAWC